MVSKEYAALSPQDKATLAKAREIHQGMKAKSGVVRRSKRCVSPSIANVPRSILDEIATDLWPWRLWQYPGSTALIQAHLFGGCGRKLAESCRGGKEKIPMGRCMVASNWCRVQSAKLLAWAERLEDYRQERIDGLAMIGKYPSGGRMPGSASPHDFKKRRP